MLKFRLELGLGLQWGVCSQWCGKGSPRKALWSLAWGPHVLSLPGPHLGKEPEGKGGIGKGPPLLAALGWGCFPAFCCLTRTCKDLGGEWGAGP